MLAEVAIDARDSEVLKGYGFEDLDAESISQFRNLFKSTSPDHPFLVGSDAELLRSLGGARRNRDTGDDELTVAGLLMFGSLVSIRERFPHYNLDYQEHEGEADRWVERVTTDGRWAGNLFQFYRKVLSKLTADLRVPFELDDELQRIDTTHVHAAVREALVNTLVHADYDATTPIRIVKRESVFEFRNPGRLRLPREQVFEGGMSDCRNPAVQTMFQMIGAGEKAGSGFPTILRAWEEQQWRSPRLEQDIEIECTTLTLSFTSLLPPEAVEGVRESVGADFSEFGHHARAVLVTAWVENHVTHERLMQVLDVHSRDLTLLLERLVQDDVLERLGTGRGCYYRFSERLSASGASSPTKDSSSPTKDSSSPTKGSSPTTKDSSSPTKDSSSPTKDSSSPTKDADSRENEPNFELLREIARPIRDTSRAKRKGCRGCAHQVMCTTSAWTLGACCPGRSEA